MEYSTTKELTILNKFLTVLPATNKLDRQVEKEENIKKCFWLFALLIKYATGAYQAYISLNFSWTFDKNAFKPF